MAGYNMGGVLSNLASATNSGMGSPGSLAQIGNLFRMQAMNGMNPFEYGVTQGAMGLENHAGAMQGAMGQMGALQQSNAAAVGNARQQQTAVDLLREDRHDKNQKFSMLFKALLGDPDKVAQEEWRNDPNTGQAYKTHPGMSPLLQGLVSAMGVSPASSGSSMSRGGYNFSAGNQYRV